MDKYEDPAILTEGIRDTRVLETIDLRSTAAVSNDTTNSWSVGGWEVMVAGGEVWERWGRGREGGGWEIQHKNHYAFTNIDLIAYKTM